MAAAGAARCRQDGRTGPGSALHARAERCDAGAPRPRAGGSRTPCFAVGAVDDRGRADRPPLHRHADRRAVAAVARQPRHRDRPAAGASRWRPFAAAVVLAPAAARPRGCAPARSRRSCSAARSCCGWRSPPAAAAPAPGTACSTSARSLRGARTSTCPACRRSTATARAFFLDRFAELVPVAARSTCAGHPPGLLLVMHALGARHARAAGGVLHRRRARSARR